MPDFTDYGNKRNHIFRMKRYKAAEERIKNRYPELKENSEQFKRAIHKLLKN